MGCQEQIDAGGYPVDLALCAIQGRVQALQEYLAVSRSLARNRHARARELRRDIRRLRAWALYLSESRRRPWWWRWLSHGARRTSVEPGTSGTGRSGLGVTGVQRLSAFSVVERAYAALQEEYQGRLLTLRLAQSRHPLPNRIAVIDEMQQRVQLLTSMRALLARHPAGVALVCSVISPALRIRQWLGLREESVFTVRQ
ncbi:hypothetical protein B5T_04241 [Alloalcanivorax dieselolei B5]|uniref:Uncharacterized protein n=1 Tax=Alcanivorax dieselolei (strain DSM 16502 / CGMCC 1.3690 / MCCC 1A00001 / B-5) TaxID=930169 RepID=K0CLJ9_ALCDB|nr:hypothetical protein [Alloalcanivorax dieselolei]AFT72501.1 hypothetical protein B5T_04241 [Alloalcanivorax dieselolei B5]GGJ78279.1 hypothetical protein GCM10007426_04260 [Alloalcanivorax dieselolei]